MSEQAIAVNATQGSLYLAGDASILSNTDGKAGILRSTMGSSYNGKIYAHAYGDPSNVFSGSTTLTTSLSSFSTTEKNGFVFVYEVSEQSADCFSMENSAYKLEYGTGDNANNLVVAYSHEHTWSDEWTTNATHHWHECTADGCEVTEDSEKDGYGEHTALTDDGNCLTAVLCSCGKEMVAAKAEHVSTGNNVATYTKKAICDVCSTEYGDVAPDDKKPEGEIEIYGDSWREFVNTITFGIFCKDTQTVDITTSDEGLGVEKAEYLITETVYADANAVLNDSNISWNTLTLDGNGKASFNIEPNAKVIVYLKITDKAGNVTVIRSNGIVLDSIAPTVSGIENGKTYCGAVEVTVSDTYFDKVTVDGNEATVTDGKFTVSAAVGIQEIIAYDKAGNTATYRITVNNGHTYTYGDSTEDTIVEKCQYCDLFASAQIKKPDGEIIYDGNEHRATVVYIGTLSCGNELKISYGDRKFIVHAGDYFASITFGGKTASVRYKIEKADPTVTWPNDLVGNVGDKLSTVALESGFTWDNGDTVIVYGDNCYGMTYTPSNTNNYNILKKDIKVNGLDVTFPTGEINLKNNKWTEFWNNLTFGLFFKETQEITITAADTDSGVKEIAYYLSSEELSIDGVKALESSKWTVYTDAFNVEPDNKYVVYARITDNTGNVIYINSDGIVLDSIKPVIAGVEDGKDVYGDATFTVDEDYLDTVTLDGEPIEVKDGKYSVPADNEEHTIVVTDKTGNQVSYKLTVYKNYKVSFMVDGKEMSASEVGYGKDATLPEIPAKDGYTAKWDVDGKNITVDTVITAVYEKIPGNPPTGDNTNIWLWVAVMFASGLSLFGIVVTKKRKEQEAE